MRATLTTLESLEYAMKMCKDCKHWTLNKKVYLNKRKGICLAAHDHTLFHLTFHISDEVNLVTKESFGCIAWEASTINGDSLRIDT